MWRQRLGHDVGDCKRKRVTKGLNIISAVMYKLTFNNAPSRRRRRASLEEAKIILLLTEASSGDLLVNFLISPNAHFLPPFLAWLRFWITGRLQAHPLSFFPTHRQEVKQDCKHDSTHQTMKHSLFLTPSPPGKVNS